MELLFIAGVDISHQRLGDLARLADQAKPFYDWVEKVFQQTLRTNKTLNQILNSASLQNIESAIFTCYSKYEDLPLLFDGIGRPYSHRKSCYYFFSWLVRDAPQQRLSPLIQRMSNQDNRERYLLEIASISSLIVTYRSILKTFEWQAIREVIIDRLEGSRRSIKGHERETIVRTAILQAIQSFYDAHKNYGVFSHIDISANQVLIEQDTYDVVISLFKNNDIISRIFVPVKTRETEGGGHAHLFSRDIRSAIQTVKRLNQKNFLLLIIIAQNWSAKEQANLDDELDQLIVLKKSPNDFLSFDKEAQSSLENFIHAILSGIRLPKPVKPS